MSRSLEHTFRSCDDIEIAKVGNREREEIRWRHTHVIGSVYTNFRRNYHLVCAVDVKHS